MPKHKLNLNAAEEPVPIDDTGPAVDVDIDEDSVLPIEPQQPDKPILGGEGGAEAVPEVKIEKEEVQSTVTTIDKHTKPFHTRITHKKKNNKVGQRRISTIQPHTSINNFQFRLFFENNFIGKTVDYY